MRPFVRANAWIQRRKFDSQPYEGFLHLGCGQKHLEGFLNVDLNIAARPDLWIDIRKTLPFPDESIIGAYTCHVLEHFVYEDALAALRETYRVLKPSAGLRIVVPSLEKALDAYLKNDSAWFGDWPDSRKSIGGRFNNYLLCRDQHKLMFDFSLLEELLDQAGFHDLEVAGYGQSKIFEGLLPEMEDDQGDLIEESLIVEAFR
jgi:predicted SAM-dependent methyltransferase